MRLYSEALYNVYIAKVHYSENTAKPFAEYLGGGKVASRARARYANFSPKNLSTRHYWCYLFVYEAFD